MRGRGDFLGGFLWGFPWRGRGLSGRPTSEAISAQDSSEPERPPRRSCHGEGDPASLSSWACPSSPSSWAAKSQECSSSLSGWAAQNKEWDHEWPSERRGQGDSSRPSQRRGEGDSPRLSGRGDAVATAREPPEQDLAAFPQFAVGPLGGRGGLEAVGSGCRGGGTMRTCDAWASKPPSTSRLQRATSTARCRSGWQTKLVESSRPLSSSSAQVSLALRGPRGTPGRGSALTTGPIG